MNRTDRRRLKRAANKALKGIRTRNLAHPVPDSVQLVGGPMDGWSVKPGAPALQADWCLNWPPSIAARHRPGMYVEDPTSTRPRQARWEPL